MARVRINFAISEAMREWIKQQTGVIAIVESSDWHVVVEHNLSGAQAIALRQAFIDKLIEVI